MSLNRRTALLGALTLPLAAGLAACNRGGSGTLDIAMISKGFQHQFWQSVRTGAEAAAKAAGATMSFEGPKTETEVAAQLQMLQAAIDRNASVICFAALDPKACLPLYETAKSKGIPIIEFDAGADSDYASSLSATDNVVAGALAAEHMAKALNNAGKIGVIGHSQINATGVDRRDGFLNYLKEKAPNIEVVNVQYADGDQLKSADAAKTMVQNTADLAGLYGTNEGSAIGIVNALKELNKTGLTVVGFDSGEAQQQAIRDGLMLGAVTQDPQAIGRITIESAVKVSRGESVEKFSNTGSFWYDKSNIDTPEMQARLYK